MSRKPEQRSLEEVRELLRSLESTSADSRRPSPPSPTLERDEPAGAAMPQPVVPLLDADGARDRLVARSLRNVPGEPPSLAPLVEALSSQAPDAPPPTLALAELRPVGGSERGPELRQAEHDPPVPRSLVATTIGGSGSPGSAARQRALSPPPRPSSGPAPVAAWVATGLSAAGISGAALWFVLSGTPDEAVGQKPAAKRVEAAARQPSEQPAPMRQTAADQAAPAPVSGPAGRGGGIETAARATTATVGSDAASPLAGIERRAAAEPREVAPDAGAPRQLAQAPAAQQGGEAKATTPPVVARTTPATTPVSDPVAKAAPPPVPAQPLVPTAARLVVPATISAEAGRPAPLPITVEPASVAASAGTVVVSGFPGGSVLSPGRAVAGGAWQVPLSDAAKLVVTVPAEATGRYDVTIELRSADATPLAVARTALGIPGRTVASPMADGGRIDDTEVLRILGEGKRQLAAGHVAGARLLFQRAADNGSGEAARLLGDTWDPAKLYALGVRGVAGDIDRAIYWYERADELGDAQAKARLSVLGR